MAPDSALMAAVLARATPLTGHDIRQRIAIYVGLCELNEEGDPELCAYLHTVYHGMKTFAESGVWPAGCAFGPREPALFVD